MRPPRRHETCISRAATIAAMAGLVALAAPALATGAWAYTRGVFHYGSAANCISAGKVPADRCKNAEANARAEFDEKAPRFPTRAACEQAYGICSIGIAGAAGWRGQRNEIYFTPRQTGFAIRVLSDRDQIVMPLSRGVRFTPRSIVSRNTNVRPYVATAARQGGERGEQFGVSSPDGPRGPVPSPAPFDPNFDCAAVVDMRGADASDPGCYPMPGAKTK